MKFQIEANKIGIVEISLHGAMEDQKRGGYYADRQSENEVHILFNIHRPSDCPTFLINRVEYRWLSWGIIFYPETGEVRQGNYQQHGESGHLRFNKNCNSVNDYPTDSARNQVEKSLLEVIYTLSTSPEFKQFALSAIKARKEEIQSKSRELLSKIKSYVEQSENDINNIGLNNASAFSLLATENIRRPLDKLCINLPRGF